MREREPQPRPEPLTPERREQRIMQYVAAMDRGDLEVISSVLLSALSDPELDRLITEVNRALHDEMMAEVKEFEPQEVDPNFERLLREVKEQKKEDPDV